MKFETLQDQVETGDGCPYHIAQLPFGHALDALSSLNELRASQRCFHTMITSNIIIN